MGRVRPAKPVKLICGLLSADQDVLRRARQLLSRKFGAVDLASPVIPFTFTDYYRDEMGADLLRSFLSFEPLVRPDDLAAAKLETNALEAAFAEQLEALEIARPINLDPGYIDQGKLVLASTKDHAHRVYLGQGVYGEVTLAYVNGAWTPWPWTYPDYRTAAYAAFFTQVRDQLRVQLAAWEVGGGAVQ